MQDSVTINHIYCSTMTVQHKLCYAMFNDLWVSCTVLLKSSYVKHRAEAERNKTKNSENHSPISFCHLYAMCKLSQLFIDFPHCLKQIIEQNKSFWRTAIKYHRLSIRSILTPFWTSQVHSCATLFPFGEFSWLVSLSFPVWLYLASLSNVSCFSTDWTAELGIFVFYFTFRLTAVDMAEAGV